MRLEIPILVAVITGLFAALGWLFAYRTGQIAQRRKDQLEFLNKQLGELYGPLYVACEAGRSAYEAMLVKMNRPQGVFDEGGPPPTDAEKREWMHWMTNVLGPLNEHRLQLILKNCHLIVEDRVPACFTDFASHVALYRVTMGKWKRGDVSEQYPHHDFPKDLDAYTEASFLALKKKQAQLLGQLQTSSWAKGWAKRLV